MIIKGNIFGQAGKTITVENGIITAIGGQAEGEVLDFGGSLVLPGFIDIHTHGAMGADTMDATDEAMQTMKKHMAAHGVTAFLPTTVTVPTEAILKSLRAAKKNEKGEGAAIIGLHLEGPYFSPENVGAQNPDYIRRPDKADIDKIVNEVPGFIRMMSLAPEVEGAKEAIRYLKEKGVVAAMGHTKADYETAVEAIRAGVTEATHLFNCMTGLTHRAPGVVGAALEAPGVYAELICDGVHVSPAAAKVAIRAKGTDKIVLISDSIRAAGMPDGEYELGGVPVIVENGTARTPGGNLAGSTSDILACVKNVLAWGFTLAEAVQMASENPAAAIGESRKGKIAPGFDADFTVLSPSLDLAATIVGGTVQYFNR